MFKCLSYSQPLIHVLAHQSLNEVLSQGTQGLIAFSIFNKVSLAYQLIQLVHSKILRRSSVDKWISIEAKIKGVLTLQLPKKEFYL